MIVYPEELMAQRIKELEAENARLQLECQAQYDRGYYDGRQFDGALDAGVDISPSIYTAISELNALLREIDQ